MKIFFTWWNRQTLRPLKTLFYGKYVGKDEFGNKYYKSKKNERWVIYSKNIEATKITSDWYLWIHHTTDKIPGETDLKKYKWQKKHLDNQTGTENSYSPIKIKKNSIPKNMKLGNKIIYYFVLIFIAMSPIRSEDKIIALH